MASIERQPRQRTRAQASRIYGYACNRWYQECIRESDGDPARYNGATGSDILAEIRGEPCRLSYRMLLGAIRGLQDWNRENR